MLYIYHIYIYLSIYICLSVTNLKDTSVYVYTSEVTTQYHLISLYMNMYICFFHVYPEQTIFTHKTHGLLPVPPLDKHPLCPLSAQVARSKVQQLYNELHKPTSTVRCYSPAVTQWNSGEFHGIFVLDFIGCYYVMMLRSTKKNLRLWDSVKLIKNVKS